MEIVIPQSTQVFGGYFKFLDIAKQSAVTFGNTVSILEPFPCPAVEEFRAHYFHDSPNPDWFEKWCFEQWLLLADWMNANNKEVVFKMDSDCLVFFDLERLWDSIARPMFTIPNADTFVTRSGARLMAEYILESFRIGKAKERCAPGCCLSDCYLLDTEKRRLGSVDMTTGEWVIDTTPFNLHGAPPFEGHKDIWFIQGQPVWIRPSGYSRMLTIHCWGDAKYKMDVIWSQSRQSIGGSHVRFHLH